MLLLLGQEFSLFGEDFSQRCQSGTECRRGDLPRTLDEAYFVNGSDLVEQDAAVLPGVSNGYTKWSRMACCGHGRDDHRVQIIVQFGRGNDEAGTGFPYLAADGGVK